MNTLTFNVNVLLDYDDAITVATVLEQRARIELARAEAAESGNAAAIAQTYADDCARIAHQVRRGIHGTANRIQDELDREAGE